MSRSVWKGPFVDRSCVRNSKTLLLENKSGPLRAPLIVSAKKESQPFRTSFFPEKRVVPLQSQDPKNLLFEKGAGFAPKTHKRVSRRSCILPEHVGQIVSIYNGRSFLSLRIKEDMVGKKFGEFASTRFYKPCLSSKERKTAHLKVHGTKSQSNRR